MERVTPTDVLPPADPPFRPLAEARAGLLTAVACLLLAAPAGLVWAALAPRITVTSDGGAVSVADPTTSAFIATDGVFLVVVALVGLVTGAVVAAVARRSAVGAVLGLAAGGLLAAEVARRTGSLVGRDAAEAVLAAGADGAFDLPPEMRSWPALVGWPVAALLGHAAVAALPSAREWWRRSNPFSWDSGAR